MRHQIIFDENDQIIIGKFEGDLNFELMDEAAPDLAKTIRDKKCNRLLLDFRGVPMPMSTWLIFKSPEKLASLYAQSGVDVRKIFRALLYSETQENYRFFETVSLNNSQHFKIFTDEHVAIQWLKSN